MMISAIFNFPNPERRTKPGSRAE